MKSSHKAVLAALALSGAFVASGAFAAGKSGGSNGVSAASPGHQMQNATTSTGPGASEYAPGQLMKDTTTTTTGSGGTVEPGASGYAPGDAHSKGKK